MAGALKTLFQTLQASSYLAGVSVAYGEEEIADQSYALPLVVMVPRGGNYSSGPGYSKGLTEDIEMVWGIEQNVDFYIWGAGAGSAVPIDNADSVETTRAALLSALQDQRVQPDTQGNPTVGGLYFKPISERWETMQGGFVRFGRALVVSTMAEISVVTVPPADAEITSESISYTVVNRAS